MVGSSRNQPRGPSSLLILCSSSPFGELGEPPHTKLIDERWLELFLAKLRDIHDYQDKKSKLSSSSRRTEDPAADKAGPDKPDKSTKKQKGKGASKGGGDEKPSSTS